MLIRFGVFLAIAGVAGAEAGEGTGSRVQADAVLKQFGGTGGVVQVLNSKVVSTFTVITTGDNPDYLAGDGLCGKFQISPPIFVPCSFRAAIEEANANPGLDIIHFGIGSGAQTITPASPLPALTQPVLIDGTTQPGFAGTPIVELNGSSAGTSAHGLVLSAGGSTVRGLVINRFDGYGIRVPSDNNVISGNFIGTDVSGTAGLGNSTGIRTESGSFNRIGGSLAGERNLISGNVNAGVNLSLGSRNAVLGNFIGTDVSGTADLGAIGYGVRIDNSSLNDVFYNLISGNDAGGVLIGGSSASRNELLGNFIGTDAGGSAPLGNGNGILIFSSSYNVIGGYSDEYRNTIAFNGGDGIRVSSSLPATGNFFIQSSIHSNGGLGINLFPGSTYEGVTPNDSGDGDAGSNDLQNFPELSEAFGSGGATTIQGTLNSTASASFHLEFFASDSCDSSGYGEGQTYIGSDTVTTDGSGNAAIHVTFPLPLPAGKFITATASHLANDTAKHSSEFCRCLLACSAEKGDLNVSGGLSPADAVLMLNCVFLATGDCDLCFTDVNCSGGLSPADVVILLNMVFGGAGAGC